MGTPFKVLGFKTGGGTPFPRESKREQEQEQTHNKATKKNQSFPWIVCFIEIYLFISKKYVLCLFCFFMFINLGVERNISMKPNRNLWQKHACGTRNNLKAVHQYVS